MPYVRRGAAFRRGMGQVEACNALTNAMCSTGAFQTLFGIPCNTCPSTQPLGAPTVVNTPPPSPPTGYDPSTGTVDPSNTTGETGVEGTFQYALPNVPGYNNDASGTGGTPAPCDWTQASWLDVTTWCSANWVIAAILGLGGMMFVAQAVKK